MASLHPQGSDYIHANYVSSYKGAKTFILTQGEKRERRGEGRGGEGRGGEECHLLFLSQTREVGYEPVFV